MHIYAISPDLFKNRNNEDEYENWINGCFKSKWDNNRNGIREDDLISDTEENEIVFNPIVLKED
jgi:hypothetical protein